MVCHVQRVGEHAVHCAVVPRNARVGGFVCLPLHTRLVALDVIDQRAVGDYRRHTVCAAQGASCTDARKRWAVACGIRSTGTYVVLGIGRKSGKFSAVDHGEGGLGDGGTCGVRRGSVGQAAFAGFVGDPLHHQ